MLHQKWHLSISGGLLVLVVLLIPVRTIQAADNFLNHESIRLTGYVGQFDANPEPQFVGAHNEYSLGVVLGVDLAQAPNLGFDLELVSTNQDYDTPVSSPHWGSLDNDTTVHSTGVLFGIRGFLPANRALRLYGVGGVGFYYTTMQVEGTLLGFTGIYEEDDTSVDFYYGAGLSYRFEQWILSVDYRNLDLRGDFSAFGISDADLGGEVIALGLGYNF